MAAIRKHMWTRKDLDERGRPRLVKMRAYGYDFRHSDGRRERKWDQAWLTPADARAALAAREKEIADGQVTPPAERTLTELAAEYLAYKTRKGKRSVRHDERLLKTRLLPGLGAEVVSRQLTAPMIAQYERRRSADVTPWTVHNDLVVLRHMLRLAKLWGYIDAVPEIVMPKMPEGRLRYLNEAEIAQLLAACRASRNPHLLAIVVLALNTGMRRAEIVGLEWERIDLATARITLYVTKSGKPRGVPMNRAVYDALTELEPDAAKRAGLLFKKRSGAAWGQVRTAWESAVKRAGLNNFRFHDLRHTCASWLVMRGASLSDVKEILGHADLKMTMRYAHLSPAHLRGAVDKLDGLTVPVAPPICVPNHMPNTAAKAGHEPGEWDANPASGTDTDATQLHGGSRRSR